MTGLQRMWKERKLKKRIVLQAIAWRLAPLRLEDTEKPALLHPDVVNYNQLREELIQSLDRLIELRRTE